MNEQLPPELQEEQGNPSPAPSARRASKKRDPEFSAHYQEAKEIDIQSLEREIEEKNSRDTKKKRRNWWIKTILMLLLIVGSVAIMFTMNSYLATDGTKSFSEMVRGVNLPWFLAFLGFLVLYMAVDGAKYAYLIKIQTGKFRFRVAFKTMFMGRYYDGITPFGTGGQPFQIYYMHKKDIPAGVATSVPLVRYIVYTIISCLCSIVFLSFAAQMELLKETGGTIIFVVAGIALGCTFLIPVAMLFASLFPKVGKKIIVGIVSLLSKLHLVKHKYPTMKKYMYEVDEYRASLTATFGAWWKPIPLIVLSLMEVALSSALPFSAVLAIAGPQITDSLPRLFFEIACLSTVSFYSAALVPTPGNSVASETMTTLVFLTVSGIDSVIGWVVLLWRFASFYVFILSGIGINIFEVIRSAVRNRKLLRGETPDVAETAETEEIQDTGEKDLSPPSEETGDPTDKTE